MSLRANLWKPLLQTALPGTAQSPAPGALGLPELQALSTQLPPTSPEIRLLNQAAAVALFQRAGELPTRRGQDLPAVAASETQPALPQDLIGLWQRLVRSWPGARFRPDWRIFQREFLEQLEKAGLRFPHRLLPELLEIGNDWGREEPLLRAAILALLGERGLWLGGGEATSLTVRNPWSWVVDPRLIETGLPLAKGPAACGLLLRRLRLAESARGGEVLAGVWSEADPAMRAALLQTLKHGLSLADEPLLEQALDDKRREVREQAQALLGQLAGSAYVARMQARVAPLLSIHPIKSGSKKGGEELEIKSPSWPSDAAESAQWQRDGFEKASFASPGSRALVVENMLKHCPPAWWPAHLGVSLERLQALILASPQLKTLASGLTSGILNFGDSAMAAAMLAQPAFWRRTPPGKMLPLALMPVLPPEQQEAGYLNLLRGGESEIPPEAWFSRNGGRQLDQPFLKAYFSAVDDHLELGARRGETDFWAPLLLPRFVILGTPPPLLPQLLAFVRRRLVPCFQAEGRENREFEELLTMLELRHDLYQQLSAPPGDAHRIQIQSDRE